MSKIKDIDPKDRPREKLISKGVNVLTNHELLQVIIGSGVKGSDVTQISKILLKKLEENNGKLTLDNITQIHGVSTATATKLLASLEIAARFVKSGIKIQSVEDVASVLMDIRNKKQEHFVLITLDGADRLIDRHIISIGTVNASMIHPRDVYLQAINDNAANIVIAHNHPSGSLSPSSADIELTKRLMEAGKLIGIPLQSHIIITKNDAIKIRNI